MVLPEVHHVAALRQPTCSRQLLDGAALDVRHLARLAVVRQVVAVRVSGVDPGLLKLSCRPSGCPTAAATLTSRPSTTEDRRVRTRRCASGRSCRASRSSARRRPAARGRGRRGGRTRRVCFTTLPVRPVPPRWRGHRWRADERAQPRSRRRAHERRQGVLRSTGTPRRAVLRGVATGCCRRGRDLLAVMLVVEPRNPTDPTSRRTGRAWAETGGLQPLAGWCGGQPSPRPERPPNPPATSYSYQVTALDLDIVVRRRSVAADLDPPAGSAEMPISTRPGAAIGAG